MLQCSLPFFLLFWVLGDVPGAGAALSPCPGPSTVQYGHAQPCCCWCWRPGALSSCHAVVSSTSVASFRLSCVCGFYTMELNCILLPGSLHCLCSPPASSHAPSGHLPDSLKPLLPSTRWSQTVPSSLPGHCSPLALPYPLGFIKTTPIFLFLFINIVLLDSCLVSFIYTFSSSLLHPPAFRFKARSQQDEGILCQLSLPGTPRAAAG